MEHKTKRKRTVKSEKQDHESVGDELSSRIKVQKTADKNIAKRKKIRANVSVAAEVGTAINRKSESKRSVMKRKGASLTADSGSVQRQTDSKLMHDTLPPRKRSKVVTFVQNAEPLPQGKRTCQSVKKKLSTVKKQRPTRLRKSALGVEIKNAEEARLEIAVETGRKKRTNVKVESELELPSASSVAKVKKEQLETTAMTSKKKCTEVKTEFELPLVSFPVKTKSVKTEKFNTACTSSKQQSCRKFIGAHVSISGLLAVYHHLCSVAQHCILYYIYSVSYTHLTLPTNREV